MSPKEAGRVVAGSTTGAGVSIYIAAVALNAELTRELTWWPYWWLWWVAGVTAAAAIVWIWLIDWRTPTPAPASPSAQVASEFPPAPDREEPEREEPERVLPPSDAVAPEPATAAVSEPNVTREPDPDPEPRVVSTPDRVEWGQMTARRMRNDAWVVTFPSGERVGSITPIGQGYFHALHVMGTDCGQHSSVEDAMRALWEAD